MFPVAATVSTRLPLTGAGPVRLAERARIVFEATRSEQKARKRDMQLAFLKEATERSGLTLTEIARAIGRNPSTLTKVVADKRNEQVTTLETLMAVSALTGVALPGAPAAGAPPLAGGPLQLREPDAAPWAGPEGHPLAAAVRALVHTPNRFPYELKSDVLAHEGWRKGDVLIVDMADAPREGDIVCAQFYARNDGERTETVMRLMHGRFLVAAGGHDPTREPRMRDDASVRIMGRVVAGLRSC